MAALRRAQVQTVVISDALAQDATLDIGAEPVQLAVDRQDLDDLGAEHVTTAPAGSAIVRAAVGTGADLVLVPGGPTRLADGVGAVLRYADAATPS